MYRPRPHSPLRVNLKPIDAEMGFVAGVYTAISEGKVPPPRGPSTNRVPQVGNLQYVCVAERARAPAIILNSFLANRLNGTAEYAEAGGGPYQIKTNIPWQLMPDDFG